MILSEMEIRSDSNPAVLRSCIRIVDYARSTGIISNQEAACHAVEVLQAIKWAPTHLDVPTIQQQRVSSAVAARTEGIRARTTARQRDALQQLHDYHGTYAPWLVDACLSLLTKSIEPMLESTSLQNDASTSEVLLTTVLRVYNSASQGKAAARPYAFQPHAALVPCTALVSTTRHDVTATHKEFEGETTALWSALAVHVKAQLRSTNPNRKTAGLVLLEALLPLGGERIRRRAGALAFADLRG